MRFHVVAALVVAAIVVSGCTGSTNAVPPSRAEPMSGATRPSTSSVGSATFGLRWWENAIGPRYQWNANFGYCGEVSFISAGLYYGQYASQYDARAAVSDAPQEKYRSQLLVGVNDMRAAKNMHLTAIEWDTNAERSTGDFLAWVKQNVALRRPVVIGIYMNQYLFYGITNPKAGSDYDHIVPVVGFASKHALDDPRYYADDVIDFSDNGEWGSGPPREQQYYYTYPFGSFQKSRRKANARNGTVYSIADDALNYGVAITGVTDEDRETIPVRVTTNINYEYPGIVNGSDQRPPAEPVELTIVVSGLRPGAAYKLYRYNAWSAVPDGRFNANASRAYQTWTIQSNAGSTYTLKERIESDEIAVYRAVPADAP